MLQMGFILNVYLLHLTSFRTICLHTNYKMLIAEIHHIITVLNKQLLMNFIVSDDV
jgi:hypothetical protein